MNLAERLKTLIPWLSLCLIISTAGSTHAQRPINVTGFVTDPNSAPIPGARISLYSLDRILQTTSDSSGHFRFDAVPTGNYEFEVLSPGFKRFTKTDLFITGQIQVATQDKSVDVPAVMEIASVGNAPIVQPMPEKALWDPCGPPGSLAYGPRKTLDGSALGGAVTYGYQKVPVVGATMLLFEAKGAEIARELTNDRGEFQFKQTAPGHYYLTFQHPAYNDIKLGEFWVARENETYIALDPVPLGKIRICQ